MTIITKEMEENIERDSQTYTDAMMLVLSSGIEHLTDKEIENLKQDIKEIAYVDIKNVILRSILPIAPAQAIEEDAINKLEGLLIKYKIGIE